MDGVVRQVNTRVPGKGCNWWVKTANGERFQVCKLVMFVGDTAVTLLVINSLEKLCRLVSEFYTV